MQIICKCAGPWQFHIYLLGWLLPLVSCSCTYTFYNLVSRSCSCAVLDSVPNSIFLLSYDVLNSKLHFKQLKLCLKKISQPTFYQKGKCGDYIFLQFYTYNDLSSFYSIFSLSFSSLSPWSTPPPSLHSISSTTPSKRVCDQVTWDDDQPGLQPASWWPQAANLTLYLELYQKEKTDLGLIIN